MEFTKQMKKTHTILIPSMLDFHFPLLTCARGAISKIRKKYPHAVISPLDFDSGMAKINQLNRIQMILNFT